MNGAKLGISNVVKQYADHGCLHRRLYLLELFCHASDVHLGDVHCLGRSRGTTSDQVCTVVIYLSVPTFTRHCFAWRGARAQRTLVAVVSSLGSSPRQPGRDLRRTTQSESITVYLTVPSRP